MTTRLPNYLTNRTYDKIAARYATRVLYPMTRELDAFLSYVPHGGLVLDIGCGPGDYAQLIAARGYRVLPLDLSSGMLQVAARRGTPRLVRADMHRLPLPRHVADGAFLSASFLHLPKSTAGYALQEIHRVLRPGGAAYWGVKEGHGSAHVTAPEGGARFFAYYQAEGFDALLRAAGFTLLEGWIGLPGEHQSHRWINRVAKKGS
ncbi:MAG TPA: class I SAM-dependent methyltransferase [Thermoflexia bacterium]|nr:class I SAM-dependent methyltransferase [Thermoflexia bacterium]